ncbi:FKBP-type peptidyl-prolyl cis-trans isomerase [Niabella ginsengisoli]|uniref:Peptidyl-prolyl cis-trans isomerase n=1 Tax=Niabella ginsengisoli TaxID=522298 RepID=A0ABS9SFI0_9BACT|nr:FKBP-type peptidyl-prolyl cis-trans isomerase [Niabella ginsengisoli]MCH5597081.1 FKBP-type peptidyl-prolyl cis-trans isomerase [Niabella ginsengisoli]
MKKISIIFLSSIITISAVAQTKAKPKTTTPAAAQSNAVVLKTLADSASYAIGQNLAQSISKDLASLNKEAFIDAIKTVFDGKETKFTEETSRSILTNFSRIEQENQSKAVVEEGRAFLEKNKANPKVKTTASGLQYEVVKDGTGVKPTAADTVVCNYIGMFTDSTQFDNSYDRGEPLTIAVDGGVIPGWTEGLQLMSTGSKYRFYIPQELGYGLRGAGSIPPGSTLIFDIELLELKKDNKLNYLIWKRIANMQSFFMQQLVSFLKELIFNHIDSVLKTKDFLINFEF